MLAVALVLRLWGVDYGLPLSYWQDEYRFICADGTIKNVFDRGFILVDNEGKPYRMIGAMMDTTERKKLQDELAAQTIASRVDAVRNGTVSMSFATRPGVCACPTSWPRPVNCWARNDRTARRFLADGPQWAQWAIRDVGWRSP